MKVLNVYNICFSGITDQLVAFCPDNSIEKKDMFRFRYAIYRAHDYIDANKLCEDKDLYDDNNTYYINVLSKKQNRIIGSVRIIKTTPLPILKEGFNFKEPFVISKFSHNKIVELSRLIVDKYDKNIYLPRHFVLFILIIEINKFLKEQGVNFAYSFVKQSLLTKLVKLNFPFFRIKKYNQKYNTGVLEKYFHQNNNPVIPIYFFRHLVSLYVYLSFFKFKKYICS